MVFYKGSISYKEFKKMPYAEILDLQKNANKIEEEIKRAHK